MSDAQDSSELDGLTQEIEAKVVQKHESQTTGTFVHIHQH